MAKKGKIADPHAEREAANYDNPIPSREVILELLTEAEKPLNHNKIASKLGLATASRWMRCASACAPWSAMASLWSIAAAPMAWWTR